MEPIEWITLTEFVLAAYRSARTYNTIKEIVKAYGDATLLYDYSRNWRTGDSYMTRLLAIISFSAIWRYLHDLDRQRHLSTNASKGLPPLSNPAAFAADMMYFDTRYAETLHGAGADVTFDPFLAAMISVYLERAAPEWDPAIRAECIPTHSGIKPVPSLTSVIGLMYSGEHPLHKNAAVLSAVKEIMRNAFIDLPLLPKKKESISESRSRVAVAAYENICEMIANPDMLDHVARRVKSTTSININASSAYVLTAMLAASERKQKAAFKSVTPTTVLMPTIPPLGRQQISSWMASRTGYVLDTTLQSAFMTRRDAIALDIVALDLFSGFRGVTTSTVEPPPKPEDQLTAEEIKEQMETEAIAASAKPSSRLVDIATLKKSKHKE